MQVVVEHSLRTMAARTQYYRTHYDGLPYVPTISTACVPPPSPALPKLT